jgi:hypothetical protein
MKEVERAVADGVPLTVMVKSALSMLRPTARDSIFIPRRANTPATLLMIPDSSATNTLMICFLIPSLSLCGPAYTSYASSTYVRKTLNEDGVGLEWMGRGR